MAPLSIKIVKDDGAVTRKVKLDPDMKVWEVHQIVKEKFLMPDDVKDYGLFLRSADNDLAGIWLEDQRPLSYYMLRNEDRLDYMSKIRNLRLRMLDGTVKTLQVDQSKTVSDLMIGICGRIGLTNHDEYGLCLDSEDETEEGKENRGGQSGTLTLKKKSQLRDRDVQFEQLSKKLKTDDNVSWIDAHKTLSEAGVGGTRTLLLKRRLFYSDRKVDARDPVQLNLLYVQARDNILQAVHPVAEGRAARCKSRWLNMRDMMRRRIRNRIRNPDQVHHKYRYEEEISFLLPHYSNKPVDCEHNDNTAVEFAGIQCQIHFGDFQEDKHKPGFLENLNEYLPAQFVNSWGIEKKVLKEYRKHAGLSPLEAKYLYTKTARAMPTYGVTFFLVKEQQKDKKKLVPRLLGINSESILRLDELTKEVLQEWPLTHVKTYHAGKGETFTLNFGDYSDKEYCVKTRDAYRIRDILEGYIDLIRKRMLSAYSGQGTDHGTMAEDDCCSSKASLMQQVANNPHKIIEHCMVGPSRIVPYEPGKEGSQGTQIVTVQQIITTNASANQQKAVAGGIPLRIDMSMNLTRRLNRFNSNSVRIVSLLTSPEVSAGAGAAEARDVVALMEEDLPLVRDGVKETIEKQSSEEERRKLEEQLRQLEELMKTLGHCTRPDTFDVNESVDAAKNIADLTTQMYFAMDPSSRRRSKLIESSRKSFIADERTESNLRRASFIAATATAIHTLDQAKQDLDEKYDGPRLNPSRVVETERSAVDNLAKLNGAIAHYLMAHSDPKNVDYSAAVTSMNTIHEYMPELVKDVRALGSVMDERARRQLVDQLKALCDATTSVCGTVGSEDPDKIHEASKNYSDLSGKLIFAFRKGSKTDSKKKDEILKLSKEVLNEAEKLAHITDNVSKEDSAVKEAGDQLRTCADRVVDQAELTAPTIHEPHCQSSLTAGCEAVSSSAQLLVARSKPLLNGKMQDALHHQTLALAEALDRLKATYTGDKQDQSPEEIQRLKFVTTTASAKKQLEDAQRQLQMDAPSSVSNVDDKCAKRRLADHVAQLNAAVAALLAATADRNHPDYKTAETAIAIIGNLMPLIAQDSQITSANQDSTDRITFMENVKALCEAASALCDPDVRHQNLSDEIAKFTDASGNLVYVVSRDVDPEREQRIVELAAEACGMTSELLCSVQQLEQTAGDQSEELDERGAALADAAQNLLTQAQVTAASISDPRCQSALLSAVDRTSHAGRQLAHAWAPLQHDTQHAARVQQLNNAMKELEEQLDKLRKACQLTEKERLTEETSKPTSQEERLKFIKSNAGAQEQLRKAIDDLKKPSSAPAPGFDPATSERMLAHRLGLLNAAVAQLLQATRDVDNPDYKKGEQSIKTISELIPQFVQDAKSSSANKDAANRAAMLDHIRSLCEATSALCQYTDGTHPQDVNDAVSKYSEATDKLMFVISPYKKHNAGKQIVELSSASCAKTSDLLLGVQQLSEQVSPDKGVELDSRGAELADAAQGLLQQAQLTSSSISEPQCRAALLTAVDSVSHAGRRLAHAWAPLQHDTQHAARVQHLDKAMKELEEQLDKLRKACQVTEQEHLTKEISNPTSQDERLKFIKSNAGAQEQLRKAIDDLKKPLSAPTPGSDPATSERMLAHRLGLLSAAVAQLVQATRDLENPDYQKAEQSVKTISELMPQVVQDAKSSSANKDAANRAAMLDHIRSLCEATSALCQYTDGTHPQDVNDAVSKYSEATDKLVFVITPHKKHNVGQQIVELSSASCAKTSDLLLGVQQLSEQVSPDKGEELDSRGAELADAAQGLLQQAQLTSSSISEPQCRAALLTAVDSVSHAGRRLAHAWAPLQHDTQHAARVQHLDKAMKELEEQLDKLRKACHSAEEVQSTLVQPVPPSKPAKPAKPEIPVKPGKPEVPKRVSSHHQGHKTRDLTKEFLDNIRFEESQAQSAAALERERQILKEKEQKQHEQFLAIVEDVNNKILNTEDDLIKWSNSSDFASSSAMSASECLRLQEKMQHQLAIAGVEVANVVAANYADKIDYPRASKSTSALPKLVADIVEDGKLLSSTVKDSSRTSLFEDMVALCRATRNICDAAKTERKKLNESAMEFGDKSAKLVYVVSTDADPTVEKEIISRAKAIGDAASRLALDASEHGASAAVCVAGTRALNHAGKLIYTAKLVSPSIHEVACQRALLTSAETLSQTLAEFGNSCLNENPENLKHLKTEADNLDRIVSTLISDVKGGSIGRSREAERLVIEDTPLRLLTIDILDDVKKLSQAGDTPISSRQEYAAYAGRVSAALRALDLATARCKRSPHDISRRSELEHAVQGLQMTLLTSRPNTADRNSNIVDLRDFIDEVSSEAHKLAEVAEEIKLEGRDKKTLQDIKSKCSTVAEEAYRLIHPDGETGYDCTFVDILHVDSFGQDCDELIRQIESDLKSIEDAKAKRKLTDKLIRLTESCNLLRFATKSGISSTKSAGLFSTLEDLDDVETRVIKNLLKDKGDQGHVTLRSPADAGSGRLSPVTSLISATRDVTLTSPRAPLTAYIAHTAATVASDTDKNKLLKHLYKLVSLFRLKALTTSKRLATWQNLDHPEVATITEQILQEIQTPESGFSIYGAKSEILNASDISKLLIPGEPKILANRKEQDLQLSKLCTKLSSMSNGVKQSIVSKESLARSARETARAACELAAVARGCKDVRNPTQGNQIEEDVEQMTFATYNLLKVAEQSTKDPNSHNTRRRLQDACRNLNNAISKLALSASSSPEVTRSCLSLSLSLQSLTPTPGHYSPPSLWLDKSTDPSTDLSADLSEELSVPSAHTMSYENATDALQNQHSVLNKLNNDERRCNLEVSKELRDVTTAVRKSTEYATQCAYLMSISESYKELATSGVADVPRIERGIERLQDSCMALIGAADILRAKEESADLSQRLSDLSLALEEASLRAPPEGRSTLARVRGNVANQGEAVHRALKDGKDMEKVLTESVQLLEVLNFAYSTVDKCPLLPAAPDNLSTETRARCDEVIKNSKCLVDKTLALVKDVESQEQTETMTWTTFSTSRKKLLEAYEALLKTVRMNGQRAGILQAPVEEEKEDTEAQQKTYLDTQVEVTNKWLYRPMCKDSVRAAGSQAVNNIMGIARNMSEEMAGSDLEELRQLLLEVEELQLQCSTSRDVDKYRMLADRIKELKKCIQRGLVTRVVEDLIDVDNPMEDLEILADTERDPQKRKYILERKIAELLSQLGRVSRTARLVAAARGEDPQGGTHLLTSTKQTELLAPKLVQAAENRINNPDDEMAIEKYKALVLEYAESIGRVRALCDQSVDPMEFVQTAGDTMQRLREESTSSGDPQRTAYASQAIIRLANRTIDVSLSSSGSQSDPELQAALVTAKARLHAAAPSGTRASKLPDIQASTAEIIKTTNEVESYLGGENIFKKQPIESNQKIFDVARSLHESVREWSSRDNEVVAAARRMAVLMAKLSEHMHTDKKQALIATSKKIVLESQEVAELAKKLAHECTDLRIKTNLLQTCERIPTISGQLKMLTTVKASSLGQQGSEEDKAAMDMLVTNAQTLMLSVQEVVKAAESASVKIMSQRGPRLRWVRKNYY